MGRLEEKIAVVIILYWLHSFSFGQFNIFPYFIPPPIVAHMVCGLKGRTLVWLEKVNPKNHFWKRVCI
jgi:hypothetical protein